MVCLLNVAGEVVKTLDRSMVESGRNVIEFDATALPVGLYFYRVGGTVMSALIDREMAMRLASVVAPAEGLPVPSKAQPSTPSCSERPYGRLG